jgi:hypothetical protein
MNPLVEVSKVSERSFLRCGLYGHDECYHDPSPNVVHSHQLQQRQAKMTVAQLAISRSAHTISIDYHGTYTTFRNIAFGHKALTKST